MKHPLSAVLLVMIILLMSVPVHAGPPGQNQLTVKTTGNYIASSRIKGSDVKLSSQRYGIQASYSHYTLSYDYTEYSWKNIPGRSPWKGLHRIALSARKNYSLNPQWIISLGGGAGTYFEKEMSESFSGRADFSLNRRFNSGWTAGLGIVGLYHPIRTTAIPFLTLNYFPPQGTGPAARIGFPRSDIRYIFSPDLSVGAFAQYSARAYRLKNSSPVYEKGYFSDQYLKLGMGLEYKPVKPMTLTVEPYYIVERKLKIYDKKTNRRSRDSIHNSPGLQVSVSWKF